MINLTQRYGITFFVIFSALMSILNALSVSNELYGYVSIFIFHFTAFVILLLSKTKLQLLVVLIFITLGLDLNDVNIASVQNSDVFSIVNISNTRFSSTPISFGIFYIFIMFSIIALRETYNRNRIILLIVPLVFVVITSLGNPLDKVIDRSLILIMIFFGYILTPSLLNKSSAKIIIFCAWTVFFTYGAMSVLGYQRPYSSGYFAYSPPFINYIFILPFLTWSIYRKQILSFYGAFTSYVIFDYLFSGKAIINFLLSHMMILGARKFLAFSCFSLIVYLLMPTGLSFLADFLISNNYIIAGVKIHQLDILNNYFSLTPHIFYNTSGGNILAEGISLFRHIFIEGYFLGSGIGGYLPDYYGYLSMANDFSYPEEDVINGTRYSLHLAAYNFLLWFGFFGIFGIMFLLRRALILGPLATICFLALIMFATAKFDAIVFGVMIYILVNNTILYKILK